MRVRLVVDLSCLFDKWMISYFWDSLGRVKESNFLKKLERVSLADKAGVWSLDSWIYTIYWTQHFQKNQKESPYRSAFGQRLAVLWFISLQNNFAWRCNYAVWSSLDWKPQPYFQPQHGETKSQQKTEGGNSTWRGDSVSQPGRRMAWQVSRPEPASHHSLE